MVFGALLCATSVWGQPAQVTMREEPHHELLTYVQQLRVFEVNLPAGELTGDHVRDHDVVTLALGDATTRSRDGGEEWSAPVMRAQGSTEMATYSDTATTHALENVGATAYRMFVVENLRDAGAWSTAPPMVAPGTTLRQETRSFAVYDVRLDAKTERSSHVHENATLVVLLSGDVEVQGGGGEEAFIMAETGRWFPSFGSDLTHTLAAADTGEAHFVCIEAR